MMSDWSCGGAWNRDWAWDREGAGHRDGAERAVLARWRTASLTAGWPFPSDWSAPAVAEVCRAV